MKQTVETYEQGTGKLLETNEIEVEDPKPSIEDEIEALKARLSKLEK